MSTGVTPLLKRYPVLHSRNVEEARAFLGRKQYGLDLASRETAQFDACINTVYMPGMYLAYIHYGGMPVELSPGPQRADYVLQFPLRGQMEAVLGAERVVSDPKRGVIVSPIRERCLLRSEADNTRIQFVLSQAALVDQLAAMLGDLPNVPIEFAPTINLTEGHGRSLAQYLYMAAVDLDRGDSVLSHATTMTAFQQFVMSGLLLSQPHNFIEALRRLERPTVPRDVKRAIEFMEANLISSINLADVVAVSGIPGRTLYKHFMDSRGVSPMRYLRDARMAKVREELLRAGGDESVTEIALRWGFTHLGRFSVEYRKRFGESPSATRRRRLQ